MENARFLGVRSNARDERSVRAGDQPIARIGTTFSCNPPVTCTSPAASTNTLKSGRSHQFLACGKRGWPFPPPFLDVSLARCLTGCYNQANLGTPTCAGCLTRPETCELNRLLWQGLEVEPERIEQLWGRTSRRG